MAGEPDYITFETVDDAKAYFEAWLGKSIAAECRAIAAAQAGREAGEEYEDKPCGDVLDIDGYMHTLVIGWCTPELYSDYAKSQQQEQQRAQQPAGKTVGMNEYIHLCV
jgi:hypothetical protein